MEIDLYKKKIQKIDEKCLFSRLLDLYIMLLKSIFFYRRSTYEQVNFVL